MTRALAGTALMLAVLCAVGGCERTAHNMYEQPRYDQGEASPLFRDGRAMRPPPPGSMANAMGDLAATSSGRRGQEAVAHHAAARAAGQAPPITRALLERGQQRFAIYCLPCHGAVGDGDGPIVRRGFPAPPSYHAQRLRDADDRHFFDVITHGHGVMYPYADRVVPEDRWAIVAYIRSLQLAAKESGATLPLQ